MGGTRFVGKPLVAKLLSQGHSLTIFTRGNKPTPRNIEHLIGDRKSDHDLKVLRGRSFDVIIDTSGRNVQETQKVIELTGAPKSRFLYLSSAGIYANTGYWPLREDSPIDSSSRHYGKVETEFWLKNEGIPFTSFRPTYIYGPGNYNPIERWFFDRILHNRPIPMPGDGQTITQLGHVIDLADAIQKSLNYKCAINQVYNCSGDQGITFQSLLFAASKACGKDPASLKIISFSSSNLDSKARKIFPLRLDHFITDTTKLQHDLEWIPKFDLENGLIDSYKNDYLINPTKEPDFTSDKILIGEKDI